MGRRILVVGGTGKIGARVCDRLIEAGFDVRVPTRDAVTARERVGRAVELVEGDVADPSFVAEVMKGCRHVHITLSGPDEPTIVRIVAAAAREQDECHLSYVSGATVREGHRWFSMIANKLEGESAVQASGPRTTIFRPTWFMESLPLFVREGKAMMLGRQRATVHPVAASDFGRMVARAHLEGLGQGEILWIHGPEGMTLPEALERYRAAKHPEIPGVGTTPTWILRGIGWLTRNPELTFVAKMMSYFDRVGEEGDPDRANTLLGAPETTLAQWLEGLDRSRADAAAA